jgi:NADPH:quinone reductase-like Zn-dependent oxidoreductase
VPPGGCSPATTGIPSVPMPSMLASMTSSGSRNRLPVRVAADPAAVTAGRAVVNHVAGVSLPDVLAREGVHPETPRVPYTPGWDLVVDQLGEGVTGFEPRQAVAAMPIHGCCAQ